MPLDIEQPKEKNIFLWTYSSVFFFFILPHTIIQSLMFLPMGLIMAVLATT